MADAAKVIRGLEFCLKVACTASSGEKCPYIGSGGADGCIYEMQSDALKLLKEQEAVRSEAVEPEMYCVGQDKYKFYRCPACKTAWYYKGNYCLGCGRKVKWDG